MDPAWALCLPTPAVHSCGQLLADVAGLHSWGTTPGPGKRQRFMDWAWGSQSLTALLMTRQESQYDHDIHAQRNCWLLGRQKPFLYPPPPGPFLSPWW